MKRRRSNRSSPSGTELYVRAKLRLGTGLLSLALLGAAATASMTFAQETGRTTVKAGAPNYVYTLDGRLKPMTREPHVSPAARRYSREYARADENAREAGLPSLPMRKSMAKRLPLQPTGYVGGPLPDTNEPAGTASRVTEVNPAASTPPIALPAQKPEPEQTEAPGGVELPSKRPEVASAAPLDEEPDVWSPEEITAAARRCDRVLEQTRAIASRLPPIKNGACGDPAPIALSGFGGDMPVTFSPPAKVNCEMADALAKWISRDLQKSAKEHLGARIIKVSVMSDYACRNISGREKLSQHAFVNALDIGGFVTSDGEPTRLLSDWGLTRRDIAAIAAAEAAKQKAEEEQLEKQDSAKANPAKDDPEREKAAEDGSPGSSRPQAVAVRGTDRDRSSVVRPQGLGGPNSDMLDTSRDRFQASKITIPAQNPLHAQDDAKPRDLGKMRFLREAHNSACKIFGTVLGPEANDAHRNHFHVDLAPRRYRNYCE